MQPETRIDSVEDPASCDRLQLRPLAEYANDNLSWLVSNLLLANQPAFIGGPEKSLKTSIALDLAVSVASGDKLFLKHEPFRVVHPVPVAIYSGESGGRTLHDTALRISRAKGLGSIPQNVLLCANVPQLGSKLDLISLQAQLQRHQIRLLILDPIYLCFGGGKSRIDHRNLFHVGDFLRPVTDMCTRAECTPIFIHHTSGKPIGRKSVHDLAFAGFSEFARQWIMIGRRGGEYDFSGKHKLWLNYGGSAGHGDTFCLDIDEGRPEENRDRKWEVTLTRPLKSALTRTDAPRESRKRALEVSIERVREAFGTLSVSEGQRIPITKLKHICKFDWKVWPRVKNAMLESGELKKGPGKDELIRVR